MNRNFSLPEIKGKTPAGVTPLDSISISNATMTTGMTSSKNFQPSMTQTSNYYKGGVGVTSPPRSTLQSGTGQKNLKHIGSQEMLSI